MTTPFVCVLLAFLLIWIPRVAVVVAIRKAGIPYDNKHPRKQQATLEGFGARAQACHQNHLEGFPMFAAAVFVAHLADGDPRRAAILAGTHVAARVFYTIAYLTNADYLRSAIWSIGMLAIFGLFVLGWL
ncbi:MAPEG family protein [Nannocystaceae bacterium ST9]